MYWDIFNKCLKHVHNFIGFKQVHNEIYKMKYEGRSIIFVLSRSRNARAIIEAADDTGTVCHESNESVQEKGKRKTES